jgi:hypothetical protein
MIHGQENIKKNTAGSIYNCTAKDVDVTTFFFRCHGYGSRRHLVSGTARMSL